ncbi:MAG: DUF2510 domain-containing protein [Aeromicrobium sp.]|nr:MAG: DUF2510 domain-containing protein [Aeromicrobium sp.]
MGTTPAGWYDDGQGRMRWWDGEKWTDQYDETGQASGSNNRGFIEGLKAEATAAAQPRPAPEGAQYVVLQVVLKEKFLGTGSGNIAELEHAINAQAAMGYRLHTISTSSSGSTGFGGGDRIQATLVFERLN